MSIIAPFQATGLTVAIDVIATSAANTIPQAGTLKIPSQLLISNLSVNNVYVFISAAPTPVVAIPAPGTPANGVPVLAGQTVVYGVPGGDDHGCYIAAIAGVAGPSRITVTPGEGQ